MAESPSIEQLAQITMEACLPGCLVFKQQDRADVFTVEWKGFTEILDLSYLPSPERGSKANVREVEVLIKRCFKSLQEREGLHRKVLRAKAALPPPVAPLGFPQGLPQAKSFTRFGSALGAAVAQQGSLAQQQSYAAASQQRQMDALRRQEQLDMENRVRENQRDFNNGSKPRWDWVGPAASDHLTITPPTNLQWLNNQINEMRCKP